MFVRGGAPDAPPSTADLLYLECDKCGAMIIGASPQYMHTQWHEKVDSDTDTYKKLLDEARELVANLKVEKARIDRMPRMK
jgi:hypothetical protein